MCTICDVGNDRNWLTIRLGGHWVRGIALDFERINS